MQTTELIAKLKELDRTSIQRNWPAELEERKLAELKHANQCRDKKALKDMPQDTYELLHGNEKFYTTVQASHEYLDWWLKDKAPGKVVLDYACGNGKIAIRAAQAGAALAIGIDISDISIRNAREAAKAAGVADRCFFLQADCERTGLPEGSIDVAFCLGMLHHVDLSYALPELRRVLKPGGIVYASEALNYNPVIKLYRNRTPSMRTEWEKNHILDLSDVRFASRFFKIGQVKYWHLSSVFGAFLKGGLKKRVAPLLDGIDSVLTRVPGLRLMSWQFSFELIREA